jgi:hypothetical protein
MIVFADGPEFVKALTITLAVHPALVPRLSVTVIVSI